MFCGRVSQLLEVHYRTLAFTKVSDEYYTISKNKPNLNLFPLKTFYRLVNNHRDGVLDTETVVCTS